MRKNVFGNTFLKRLSQGRWPEISGNKTVLLDSFMKSLDLQTLANEMFENLPSNLNKFYHFTHKELI